MDVAANQVLRATITTEQFVGPGTTRWKQDGWISILLLARGPILNVLGGQIAPRLPPLQFTTVPANQFYVNSPPLGIYGTSVPGDAGEFGQSVTMGGQLVTGGRGSAVLQVQYANGWPHCSLTQAASAGDTALHVDDCTGFAPPAGLMTGAAGILYDMTGGQETATVTAATVTQGPGVLTVTPALMDAHQAGVIFSAMPATLQWASILFGVAQALTRGATATTPQTLSPSGVKTGDGAMAIEKAACAMVRNFRRVW